MRSSPPSIWRRNEEAHDAARPVVSSAASSHSFRRFPRSPSIRQGGRGRRRLGAGASPLLRLSVGCTETRHTHTHKRARVIPSICMYMHVERPTYINNYILRNTLIRLYFPMYLFVRCCCRAKPPGTASNSFPQHILRPSRPPPPSAPCPEGRNGWPARGSARPGMGRGEGPVTRRRPAIDVPWLTSVANGR